MGASRCAAALIFVSAIGCGVSKDEWIDKFEPLAVAGFCEPGTVFRACFDTDASDCAAEARKTVHACVQRHRDELPARLDTVSGEKYGRVIGECAGIDYEKDMRAQHLFNDSPECKEAIAKAGR